MSEALRTLEQLLRCHRRKYTTSGCLGPKSSDIVTKSVAHTWSPSVRRAAEPGSKTPSQINLHINAGAIHETAFTSKSCSTRNSHTDETPSSGTPRASPARRIPEQVRKVDVYGSELSADCMNALR